MDQYGTLIISIMVIVVRGQSRAIFSAPVKTNSLQCTRSEAQTIVNQHARENDKQRPRQDYSYDWQPDREQMAPSIN